MNYNKAQEKPDMKWADILTVQLLAANTLKEGGDITKAQFDSFAELLNTTTVVCQDKELVRLYLERAKAKGLHLDKILKPFKEILC